MTAKMPLYEGDGYIRPGPADLDAIERQARALRAHAMAGLFARLIERLANWIERGARRSRQRSVEQFLAQATDHADLEHRIKRLERAGWSTGY